MWSKATKKYVRHFKPTQISACSIPRSEGKPYNVEAVTRRTHYNSHTHRVHFLICSVQIDNLLCADPPSMVSYVMNIILKFLFLFLIRTCHNAKSRTDDGGSDDDDDDDDDNNNNNNNNNNNVC